MGTSAGLCLAVTATRWKSFFNGMWLLQVDLECWKLSAFPVQGVVPVIE